MFQLDLVAEMLEDARVERQSVRLKRLPEAAGAQRPVIVEILCRRAPGVTTRIGCVVVRAVGRQSRIHELAARVVGIAVVVK